MLCCLFLLLLWSSLSGARRPNQELIEGVIFRVPGINVPPIIFPRKEGRNGTITYAGIMAEAMGWMMTRYKLKFEFVELEESVASKVGFLFADAIRMLVDKEIDMITMPMPMKWDQLSKVDYSYPNQFEEYTLMQKYPEEESRLSAILKPFSMTVWICTIAIIVIFIIILTIFTNFHPKWIEHGRKLTIWEHFSQNFEYVAAVIAYQGYYVPYTAGSPLFILCGFWGLMMLVLTYAYTGNLTSCLVTPTYHPIANTLEDLIEMNMKITAISETPLAQSFLTAVSGTNKILGDFLHSHPDMIATTFDAAAANVLREKDCAFIGQADLVRVLIGKNYELQRKCSYTASKALSYMEHYAYTMAKGNPYMEFISASQLIFWECGFTRHWIATYIHDTQACYVKKNPQSHNASLNLVDVSSAFLLLAFGTGLSTAAFIVEHVASAINNSRNSIRTL